MADSAFSFPFNDFVRTAQTGCTLCSLIYEAYAGFATLGSASDDIFGKVTIWPGSLDRPLDIAYPRTSTSSPIRLEFFVPEGAFGLFIAFQGLRLEILAKVDTASHNTSKYRF